MDEKQIFSLLSENAVSGTVMAGMVAMLYKIWRILKSDRKVDDLDSSERLFREELKKEIVELRQEKKILEEAYHKVIAELTELRATIRFCRSSHPETCPIFRMERTGRENDTGNR